MPFLHCLIRGIRITETPEEKVRQALLQRMIGDLGYPKSTLAVEKGLAQMPHLALNPQKLPHRRADIVCFASGLHPDFPLSPLALIECKAGPLSKEAIQQAVGYNYFLKACFIVLANQDQVMTGWYSAQEKGYRFVPFFPPYADLLSQAKNSQMII